MNPILKYKKMLKIAQQNADFESFEDFENIEHVGGIPISFRPKVKQGYNTAPSQIPANVKPSAMVAQFDIKITKHGKNFDGLPIVIFNPLNQANSFANFLTGLPAGVSVASVAFEDNRLRFDYTDGIVTDTIYISGITAIYSSFMRGLQTAEFTVNKIRLASTDGDYANCFAQKMSTGKNTIFGKISDLDAIPFQSQKSPMQYDKTILDLDVNLHFQNDKGIIYTLPAILSTPLVMSFFVTGFINK